MQYTAAQDTVDCRTPTRNEARSLLFTGRPDLERQLGLSGAHKALGGQTSRFCLLGSNARQEKEGGIKQMASTKLRSPSRSASDKRLGLSKHTPHEHLSKHISHERMSKDIPYEKAVDGS